jgi:hypothetical protein
MRPSKLKQSKPKIAARIQKAGARVYRIRELGTLLDELRAKELVAKRLSVDDFVEFLESVGLVKTANIKRSLGGSIARYYHGDLSPYELGLSIRENSYLSHGSAAFLHGLNDQLPSVVYVNREQTPKPEPKGALLQANVDRAFAHPQRTSKYVFSLEGANTSFTILSGKNTGNYGVVEVQDPMGRSVSCTNLERTLVDIVVRPSYAGGVAQVLESYETARDRVSVEKLVETLETLQHFYPYHQAIGFYMERAGYSDKQMAPLRRLPVAIDFYLVHAMKRTEFNSSWRIHYPKGL